MGNEEEPARKKHREKQKKLAEAKRAEEQLKGILRGAVDAGGYDRLSNVQHANPQLFLAAAQNIVAYYRRTQRRLTDNEVRELLLRIREMSNTESKITFQWK